MLHFVLNSGCCLQRFAEPDFLRHCRVDTALQFNMDSRSSRENISDHTDSFGYSASDHDWLAELDEDLTFLEPKEIEKWLVDRHDDHPDALRRTWGFGSVCPLQMAPGQGDVCKSFKDKAESCKSCVSERAARNYLARHAHTSGNLSLIHI